MNFEVKNVTPVGGVREIENNSSVQSLNITVGVVDCPYSDISVTRTVDYEFSNEISVAEAKAGITTFAAEWVAENYPNI